MQSYSMCSSSSKKCVICGRKTSEYQVFEQSEIVIEIPVHDDGCVDQLNVGDVADKAIRTLTKSIKESKGGE